MFQLRGHLGGGEMDCAANPNDPVCVAYYGTSPTGPTYSTAGASAAIQKLIRSGAAAATYTANQQNPQGAVTAGSNVVIQGQQSPIAATVGSMFSWVPWWAKLGVLLGGGYLAYKKLYKPKAG